MLVAAVTTWPLAYLYETGRSTIRGPAVVHAAIDSFTFVIIPATMMPPFSPLLAAVSLVIPPLALAVPRHVLARRVRSAT